MFVKRQKQYWRDNPNLKNANVELEYTEEQLDEYYKCSEDPIYFIQNYCKIVHADKGLIQFKLYDFQEEYVNLLHNNRFVISKQPRQVGKCFCSNTPIKLRNKKTGKVLETTIGEFYKQVKK